MIIGFDTLSENPESPTSAINYLIEFSDYFKDKDQYKILLFVSKKNRHLFKNGENTKFVNCHFSNENIILRILVQQILIPIYLLVYRADIIFSPLNSAPLLSPVPVILKINTLHHLYFKSNSSQSFTKKIKNLMRRIYRFLFFHLSVKKSETIIANTIYTKNEIIKHYNIADDKVKVVYEAAGKGFGKFEKLFSKNYIKEKFGINFKYIIYPAGFWEYKNHYGALEAYNIFQKKRENDIKLLFVGRDEENIKKSLIDRATVYGISDMIYFIDFVDIKEIVHLINVAEVLFFPSKMETFGKPIVEAMASKTLVVGANNTSIPELLKDDTFLCPPEEYDCFANKLLIAINNNNLDYIEKNYERSTKFTYDNSFKNLSFIFEKIIKKSNRFTS